MLRSLGLEVDQTASTGAAAQRLSPNATTLHSHMSIHPKAVFMSALSPFSATLQKLRAEDVLVVDELSMLTRPFWDLCLHRLITLEAGRPCTVDELLKKHLIILIGDHLQLPPVCRCRKARDKSIDEYEHCLACDITLCPHFQAATKHNLPFSVRHVDDPEFGTFLDIARVRPPTEDEIDAVITQDMYCEEEALIETLVEEDLTLCSHKVDCFDINKQVLPIFFPNADIHQTPVLVMEDHQGQRGRSHISIDDLPDEVQEWATDQEFHGLPAICIGARVMLTDNMKKPGCVNGAMGTVTHITLKDGIANKVHIKLESQGNVVTLSRSSEDRRSFNFKTYYKRTFPLTLAYAITGHKVRYLIHLYAPQ